MKSKWGRNFIEPSSRSIKEDSADRRNAKYTNYDGLRIALVDASIEAWLRNANCTIVVFYNYKIFSTT